MKMLYLFNFVIKLMTSLWYNWNIKIVQVHRSHKDNQIRLWKTRKTRVCDLIITKNTSYLLYSLYVMY